MKKQILKFLLSLTLIGIFSFTCFAQAPPQAISYQAVARDNNGNILSTKTVSLRFTVHDATAGGAVVYQETQSATTNVLGLVNLSIGTGAVVSGTFAGINWGSGPKYLEVEIDPTGGSSYTSLGTSQMLSVPYALYAGNGGSSSTNTQNVYEALGTGSVTVSQSVTTYTLIPGLAITLNVPANSILLIQATGGMTNDNGTGTTVAADVSIYVDGVPATDAATRIAVATVPSGFNNDIVNWVVNSKQILSVGSHTIDVRTLWNSSSTDFFGDSYSATVSDPSPYFDEGQLIITVINQ